MSISLTLLAIVWIYLACFSGVLAIPSRKPSTYPLIAVSGVFKSCEIFLISSFSSASDLILSSALCLSTTLISSKSRHTSPISLLDTFGISKSILPSLILSVASFSLLSGLTIELYIHRVSPRLVITSTIIITNITCIINVLTCGRICFNEVTIDTL